MTLQAKIEADAERLRLPEGRTAEQELGRFKSFLRLETHRLKMLHRAGAGGLEICRARAEMLDVLLQRLWDAALRGQEGAPASGSAGVALVALGGYGRAELNPHSDIDLMVLHEEGGSDGAARSRLSRLVDGLLYPLWDIGLEVGHVVRTIEDCLRVGRADMRSKTALLEARLISGDAALFERFQHALLTRCIAGHEQEYIRARLEDQARRRARFGNSACMQEPNLKEGCGGLRDFQNLLWMAFVKYRVRSLLDLQAREWITPTERRQLAAAHDFLLRVRTELHYHVNRPCDVLSKNLQPAVAYQLGYKDRSPARRLELFMRDLYTHCRHIYLLTRTLEERLAPHPPADPTAGWRTWMPARPARPAAPVDGFRFAAGCVQAVSPQVFREDPRRLLRVFRHAQQRGLKLHPDLARLVRRELALVNRSLRNDPRACQTFLGILNERGAVASALRAMHEVGLLGRFLPEFGRLTCLVQHEFYHLYSADEHTLMCLEQLDRLGQAQSATDLPYAMLFQKMERPYLLYLAVLLHDTGKALTHGKHAVTSALVAGRVAARLGLDAADTRALVKLTEHHLLMAVTSQRRDIQDPAVIQTFAATVGDVETLNRLTLLTYVDAQATSDKLWNGFKDALLRALHERALEALQGDARLARTAERRKEELLEATRAIAPAGIVPEELRAHFDRLPERYFHVRGPREIARDLELAHEFMRLQLLPEDRALEPVVGWHDDTDRGYTTVKVCTWDRAGLFCRVAGSLSAAGLNILSAQVFTRADDIALDTFYVTDARTGVTASQAQRARFEELLTRALTGGAVDFRDLIARQRLVRPLYSAYEGEGLPTRVRWDNDASENRTLIEVETEDRVGLLFGISEALTALGLNISAAVICTERGAAIDSFYVTESGGGKVLNPDRLAGIRDGLLRAIQDLGRG